LVRREAKREAEGAVAIVRVEPVVASAEVHAGGDEDGFVAGAADLKENQALVLELDFLVVDPSRQEHRPIGSEQLVAAKRVDCAGAGNVALRARLAGNGRTFHARGIPSGWR